MTAPSYRELILAFDIGTSSLRTALFDAEANRIEVSSQQISYRPKTSVPGESTIDPKVFLKSAESCLRHTLGYLGSESKELRTSRIIAVSSSCFCHSCVGFDEAGNAKTPIITWADSRCSNVARDMREKPSEKKFSEKNWHARTGCMLRSSFWPARMTWFFSGEGKAQDVEYWASPAEWLFYRLFKIAQCSHSMASGTGFYHTGKRDWDDELLGKCGMKRTQMFAASDTPVLLSRNVTKKYPALEGALFYPAIGDSAASNLGCDAREAGVAAINFGTSGAIRVIDRDEQTKAPFGLFCYRVDDDRKLVGGAISNAGNLRAWCWDHLRLPVEDDAIEKELSKRPAPEHGLTVLPFLVAERAPTWCEEIPSQIVGLSLGSDAYDMLQACIEASYIRLYQIYRSMVSSGIPIKKIIVSGGILKSASSVQRLSNVFGCEMEVCPEPEASMRGAVVFALEKLNSSPPKSKTLQRVRPNQAIHKSYLQCVERQSELEILAGKNFSLWKR